MPEPSLKPKDSPESGKKQKPKEGSVSDLAHETRSKVVEIDSTAFREAEKRGLDPEQWLDLNHLVEASVDEKVRELWLKDPKLKAPWIDAFQFGKDGTIRRKDGLKLNRISALNRIPDHLSVDGPLWLMGCENLLHLPKDLEVFGTLWLTGSGVTELPEDLKLGQDPASKNPMTPSVVANRCPNLRTVLTPHFQGNVSLAGCPLVSLPEGFRVDGMLCLDESTIQTLPGKMKVGSLSLVGCGSLKELPKDLEVTHELTLSKGGKKAVENEAIRLKNEKKIGKIRYL
jgi:hypothetical protein